MACSFLLHFVASALTIPNIIPIRTLARVECVELERISGFVKTIELSPLFVQEVELPIVSPPFLAV